jgi:hypothetical protein
VQESNALAYFASSSVKQKKKSFKTLNAGRWKENL